MQWCTTVKVCQVQHTKRGFRCDRARCDGCGGALRIVRHNVREKNEDGDGGGWLQREEHGGESESEGGGAAVSGAF
jgi:hypothetical protein